MRNAEPNWVVISIAHGEERAEQSRELLTREGFVCRLNPIARATSSGEACFEVLALASEAQEARDILIENGL